MKNYTFTFLLVLCVACTPKESGEKPAAPEKTREQAKAVTRTKTPKAAARESSSEKTFVTWDGKCTNLVFQSDHDKLLSKDKRTPDELQKEIDAAPDNADAWFALAKCYWDRYGEVSNAAACFQTARELAPDALAPHLYLAEVEVARLNIEEAAKMLRAAYAFAKDDKDKKRYANVVTAHGNNYLEKGFSPQWAIELLKEITDDTPYAYEGLAELHLRQNRQDDALPWIKAGLGATTNIDLQSSLLRKFRSVKGRRQDDEEFEQSYKQAVEDAALPEFDKLIVEIGSLNYYEREAKCPSLCRRAAALATNTAQRFRALQRLADTYAANDQPNKLKEVIGEMLGTNTPSADNAERIARWFRQVSETNEAEQALKAAVATETNELKVASMMLSLASPGKDIDEDVIEELIGRFPSNANVLVKIANLFSKKEWYDREIECRERALALMTDPEEQARQVVLLVKRRMKFDELDEAEELVSTYSNVLSNNANLALTLSRLYCAKGETNDAFELLIEQCRTAKYEKDRERLVKRLLTVRWPHRSQRARAADTAREVAESFSFDVRSGRRQSVYNMLIDSYISLKRPDDALKACKKAFMQGGKVGSFATVCRLVNDPAKIETFVRDMLSEGGSQTHFYATAARACEKAELPELACELFAQAWKTSEHEWWGIELASRAAKLAHELENLSLRDEILDDLIEKCKKGEIHTWSLWQVGSMMRKFKMDDQYEETMNLIVENSKGDQRSDALQQLSWWYRTRNDTSAVRNLIATHFEGRDHSIDDSLMLVDMYFALGDVKKVKPFVAQIEMQITNHVMISRYGQQLLWTLSRSGERERAGKLLRQWINDPEFPARKKLNFLHYLRREGSPAEAIELGERIVSQIPEGHQREHALGTLIELYAGVGNVKGIRRIGDELMNSPSVSTWRLRNIADKFKQLNLPADALMVYERLLEKAGDNESERAHILGDQVGLYLKLGDTATALACARESAAARPNYAGAHTLLAKTYAANDMPQEAISEYCRALRLADSAQWQSECCTKIGELLHNYDVDFDASSVANSLLSENRTIQTLVTAATLLSAGGEMKRAERLITEAASSAKVDSQREPIYQRWVQIVRGNGDERQLLQALRAYYPVAGEWRKMSAMQEVSRLLVDAGEYEQAISEGRKMLKDVDRQSGARWAKSRVQANIARAYMELGDVDEAWKAAQDMPGGSQMWGGGTDWNTYMSLARELGKEEEATVTLEKEYNKGTPRAKSRVALHLLQAYQDAGREEDVEELLSQADDLVKNTREWERARFAQFFKEAGQTDKAIDLLKNLAENGNQWSRPGAARQLFEIYKEAGKLDEALEWAKTQAESSPMNAMLAAIYSEQDEPEKSVELYAKALETLGTDQQWQRDQYRRKLAEAAAKSGKSKKLIDKFARKVIKEGIDSKQNAHRQAAQLYQAAKIYDDAIDHYKKAVKLTRNKIQMRGVKQQYASCLSDAAKYDEAASVYNKILKDENIKWENRIGLQNKLAETYGKGKRPNKAKDIREEIVDTCETFLKEHKYGRRAMDARFALADAHIGTGSKTEARRILQKIVDKYKHTPSAKRAEKKLKEM